MGHFKYLMYIVFAIVAAGCAHNERTPASASTETEQDQANRVIEAHLGQKIGQVVKLEVSKSVTNVVGGARNLVRNGLNYEYFSVEAVLENGTEVTCARVLVERIDSYPYNVSDVKFYNCSF